MNKQKKNKKKKMMKKFIFFGFYLEKDWIFELICSKMTFEDNSILLINLKNFCLKTGG